MKAAPPLFHLKRGESRLVVSVPHAGIFVPDEMTRRLTNIGRGVPDTDWHVDRLYGFLADLDVTVLVATHSRYVVDLNRGPDGVALYPGLPETTLVPMLSFDGVPLWCDPPPDASEIAWRRAQYWQPYHDTLSAELSRIRARHGEARLLDAHSIASMVPRLFAGELPHLSFGTNDGAAAGFALTSQLMAEVGTGFTKVLNGRFKGGWITRHYGEPHHGVQAIQLELARRAYLDEAAPEQWDAGRAAGLQLVLRRLISVLIAG